MRVVFGNVVDVVYGCCSCWCYMLLLVFVVALAIIVVAVDVVVLLTYRSRLVTRAFAVDVVVGGAVVDVDDVVLGVVEDVAVVDGAVVAAVAVAAVVVAVAVVVVLENCPLHKVHVLKQKFIEV